MLDGDDAEARLHVLANGVDDGPRVRAGGPDERVVPPQHVDRERTAGHARHGERRGKPDADPLPTRARWLDDDRGHRRTPELAASAGAPTRESTRPFIRIRPSDPCPV